MKVLGIETATHVQAVALLDGERLCEHHLMRVAYDHGSSLLANVDAAFEEPDFKKEDVELYAVGIGPGSFTGLRIGLATAKGLARAFEAPIVGVSTLAAIAYTPARLNPEATVLASIDARRREVYAGAYQFEDGRLVEVLEDRAVTPAKWLEQVEQKLSGPVIQTGNGWENYDELRNWDRPQLDAIPTALAPPSAVAVARLGRELFDVQGGDDLVNLQPNYIRPSDAQLPDEPPGEMPPDPDG